MSDLRIVSSVVFVSLYQILVPNGLNGHRTVVATLQPGNYFGEISLLKLDEGHNRYVLQRISQINTNIHGPELK